MSTYSFKSSGKTKEQEKTETLPVTQIPFGIKTPMQLGSSDGIFAMNYSLEDQFADNLRNLLLTNWGDRLGLYEFGANLRPLTAEFTNLDDFDEQAIGRIKQAVERWMPFVDLDSFSSSMDHMENKNTAILRINIAYSIPALSNTKRGLQIVLYVI